MACYLTLPKPMIKKVNVSPLEQCVNSLAPGKFELNFRYVIFTQILVIAGWGISCEIALK